MNEERERVVGRYIGGSMGRGFGDSVQETNQQSCHWLCYIKLLFHDKLLVEQGCQCLATVSLKLFLSFNAIFDLWRHLVARCEGITHMQKDINAVSSRSVSNEVLAI